MIPQPIYDANNNVSGTKYRNDYIDGGVVKAVNPRTGENNLTEKGYDAVARQRVLSSILETIDQQDLDFIISSDGDYGIGPEVNVGNGNNLEKQRLNTINVREQIKIFREQISKKEINSRLRNNKYKGEIVDDIDYDMIDKIVKRLKFFKIFDARVR